ncbi:MAG TPA: 3'(2'),5'-bisphosphate nucleotidase CysQ [Alphaproteobacteria bacterium]|nr:3'(2'),5'-bisphosphate nucleotidase CysQ [Alphaproteobacteria bacterium]
MSLSLSDARALANLAREAGALILRIRAAHLSKEQDWAHAAKGDGSPVTRADQEAEAHILAGLKKLGLSAPVVAEETASAIDVSRAESFYLIDPLDGTRAFVGGGDDFCVNIGLIHKGAPAAGALHVPVTGESYFAAEGQAWFSPPSGIEEKISVRPADPAGLDVIVNRTEDWSGRLSRYLETLPVRELHRRSSAHKLALVARGQFDLYPRFGGSYEWDTAAGDAILRAAGGAVKTLDGAALTYGKKDFLNSAFIASGKLE